MNVGNNKIDDDHKNLVQIINSIEEMLTSTKNKEEISKLLNQLAVYTKEHFTREERIMREIGYPRYFQHFKEHHKLRSQLEDIKDKIMSELQEPDTYDDLIELLRHWLLDHVIKEDLLMRPHFK